MKTTYTADGQLVPVCRKPNCHRPATRMVPNPQKNTYWCSLHQPSSAPQASRMVPLVVPKSLQRRLNAPVHRISSAALAARRKAMDTAKDERTLVEKLRDIRLNNPVPAPKPAPVPPILSSTGVGTLPVTQLLALAHDAVELRADVERVKQEIDRLTRTNELLREEVEDGAEERSVLRTENHNLKQEIARLRTENEQLVAEGIALLDGIAEKVVVPPASDGPKEADSDPALASLDLNVVADRLDWSSATRPLTIEAAAARDFKKLPDDTARTEVIVALSNLSAREVSDTVPRLAQREHANKLAGEPVYQVYATAKRRVLLLRRGAGFTVYRIVARSDSTMFRGEH